MRKDAFQPTRPFVQEVMRLAEPLGMSHNEVSRAAGLTPDFLYRTDKRGEGAGINIASAMKLAALLKVDVGALFASEALPAAAAMADKAPRKIGAPDHIPILGLAAGAAIGSFQITSDPIGYVVRPPALAMVSSAYALYVENESMSPAYRPGDLVFVNPAKPPRRGDTVIIQARNNGGEPVSYIKFLDRRGADWVVAHQINPAAEIKFRAETVTAVHLVPTVAELFNA